MEMENSILFFFLSLLVYILEILKGIIAKAQLEK
jgi:hypothetical protein